MRASPAPSRRRLVVLSAGLCLLMGVPIGWSLTRPTVDVGSLPAHRNVAVLGRSMTPSPQSPAVVDGGSGALQTSLPTNIAVQSARLRDIEAPLEPVPVPVEISIKALGVNAPVLPVGIARAGGNMQIPQDVRVVGWYRFGPFPGQLGSAILVGHVDSRAQGAGAFFRLAHLSVGASIIVRSHDGSSLRFEVVARRSYPKGGLPAWIFDRTGPPTLALVTCGGSFDRRLRRYADNIVIFAVPV